MVVHPVEVDAGVNHVVIDDHGGAVSQVVPPQTAARRGQGTADTRCWTGTPFGMECDCSSCGCPSTTSAAPRLKPGTSAPVPGTIPGRALMKPIEEHGPCQLHRTPEEKTASACFSDFSSRVTGPSTSWGTRCGHQRGEPRLTRLVRPHNPGDAGPLGSPKGDGWPRKKGNPPSAPLSARSWGGSAGGGGPDDGSCQGPAGPQVIPRTSRIE